MAVDYMAAAFEVNPSLRRRFSAGVFSPAPATAPSPQPTGAQLENLNKTGVRLWT